jgi:Tol biopolymer transport system component
MYNRAAVGAPLLTLASIACLDIKQGLLDLPDVPNEPDVNPPVLVVSRPDSNGNWDIYGDDLSTVGIPNLSPSDSASGSERLTNHPARDQYPSISPDGLRVAFQSQRDGDWEIYVTDTGGALRPTRITEHPARDVRPAWSPDGSTIAFASDRGGEGLEIYRSSPDGLDPTTRLTNRRSASTDPNWSPDGSQMAFSSIDESGFRQIYVMNADGTEQVRLTNTAGVASESPAWSPDGSEIAFVRGSEIWIMNVDGSDQRVLVSEAREFLSAPEWNSSSAATTIGLQLTCCVRPQGIYVYNRFSGSMAFLTTGREPDWH